MNEANRQGAFIKRFMPLFIICIVIAGYPLTYLSLRLSHCMVHWQFALTSPHFIGPNRDDLNQFIQVQVGNGLEADEAAARYMSRFQIWTMPFKPLKRIEGFLRGWRK
jgi:hypothetical protein